MLLLMSGILPVMLIAQNNVGIGTTNPSEKLEVSGIVYTNTGGIRFPDQTLQETAAFNEDGPEDAVTPGGNVYVLIETNGPAIEDTIWLYAISQGGLDGSSFGQSIGVPFRLTKAIDASSVALFQKSLEDEVMAELSIHFTTSEGILYQRIELEGVTVEDIGYRLIYRGNGEYAHLEEIEIGSYQRMEFWHFGPGPDPCFCWDFTIAQDCSCD